MQHRTGRRRRGRLQHDVVGRASFEPATLRSITAGLLQLFDHSGIAGQSAGRNLPLAGLPATTSTDPNRSDWRERPENVDRYPPAGPGVGDAIAVAGHPRPQSYRVQQSAGSTENRRAGGHLLRGVGTGGCASGTGLSPQPPAPLGRWTRKRRRREPADQSLEPDLKELLAIDPPQDAFDRLLFRSGCLDGWENSRLPATPVGSASPLNFPILCSFFSYPTKKKTLSSWMRRV